MYWYNGAVLIGLSRTTISLLSVGSGPDWVCKRLIAFSIPECGRERPSTSYLEVPPEPDPRQVFIPLIPWNRVR